MLAYMAQYNTPNSCNAFVYSLSPQEEMIGFTAQPEVISLSLIKVFVLFYFMDINYLLLKKVHILLFEVF